MRKKTLLLLTLMMFNATWAMAQSQIFAGFTATSGVGGTGNEGYPKLVDNKFTSSDWTKWCYTLPGNTTTYVEFHSDVPFVPTSYIFTTGNDNQQYPGRNPNYWRIYTKLNEDDAWTTLAEELANSTMRDYNFNNYEFNCTNPNSMPYKYFRFEVSGVQSGNVLQLCELRFRGTPYVYDLSYGTISGISDSYRYTGQAIPLAYTVKDSGNTTLTLGTDYTATLTYEGNPVDHVEAMGNYTLTITGTGSCPNGYHGSKSVDFVVESCPFRDDSNNYYTWEYFAAHPREHDGTIYLEHDITVNTAVTGTYYGDSFYGTFDGQGHTITINYTAEQDYSGFFLHTSQATIKNLRLEGTITSSYPHASSLIGKTEISTVIENVISNVTITCNYDGAAHCGGLVGYASQSTTFTGCAFTGSINGATATTNCGFIGDMDIDFNHTFTDCLFAPSSLTINTNDGYTFAPSTTYNTFTNCYYTQAIGTSQGRQAYSVTGGAGIDVAMSGEASETYNVSDIDVYASGIVLDGNVYAADGDNLTLNLGGSSNGYYQSSHGNLTGSANPYTLVMEAYDTEITASDCIPPTNLSINGLTLTWNGEGSNYRVEVGTTTTTIEPTETIIDDGFEGSLDNWTVTSESGTRWEKKAGTGHSDYQNAYEGSYNIGAHSIYSYTTYLILNTDLTSYQDIYVDFYYISPRWTYNNQSYYDKLYLQQSADGVEYTNIYNNNTWKNSWDHNRTAVSTGTKQIRFKASGGDNFGIGLDKVVVTGKRVTTNTTWTTVANNVTGPYTLHGLLPNTTYKARVISTCGHVSEELTFTTPNTATFTKSIAGHNGNSGNYHLIASPLHDDIAPTAVTNMIAGTATDYDLYRFDQSQALKWVNYKSALGGVNSNFGDIVAGQGYLYANRNTTNLTFNGIPYQGNGQITLSKVSGTGFSGWNLIGNPFAAAAILKDANNTNQAYYTLNPAGSEIVAGTLGDPIAAMEGVFVVAETDNQVVTFTEAPQQGVGKGLAQVCINLSQSCGNIIDRAIVRFDGGGLLPKLQLNTDNTKIYITEGNFDYAVVRSTNEGEIPLSFEAAENGAYTINVIAEDLEMNYLHLIDNMTGANVDLLATPNYTFNATTSDYASRFRLVFVRSDANENNEAFAFVSNGEVIITNADGKCTLQIVDVTGRIVVQGDAINRVSTSGMTPGVYVLRLINGDDVKTQEIVVE